MACPCLRNGIKVYLCNVDRDTHDVTDDTTMHPQGWSLVPREIHGQVFGS